MPRVKLKVTRTAPQTPNEDDPKILLFVDILGFAALTAEYRVRAQHREPDAEGFESSGTTEMQNRLNRFNNVLDRCVASESLNGGIQAMLFSDCAILVLDNSLRAAVVATELMRNFILRGVPVRMGLAKGTFYDIEYSATTDRGSVTVSKSRFIGTAAIGAHAAEQCGEKGIRILLDSSLNPELAFIRKRVKTLPLKRSRYGVSWELDYLYEPQPAGVSPTEDEQDRRLFDRVAWLKNPAWSKRVQRHYTQTLAAMNRMSTANSRELVKLRRLTYGGPVDILW